MIAAFILNLNESKKGVEKETIVTGKKKRLHFYMNFNTWCNLFFFFFCRSKLFLGH